METLNYNHVGKVIGRRCGKSMATPFGISISISVDKDSLPVINGADGFTESCYIMDEDFSNIFDKPSYDLWKILRKGSDSKMFELNIIPKRIIVSGPCTIFFWNDKTKTVVRCSKTDEWDTSDAIVAAYTKKLLGDRVYSNIKQKSNSKRIFDMIEWKD